MTLIFTTTLGLAVLLGLWRAWHGAGAPGLPAWVWYPPRWARILIGAVPLFSLAALTFGLSWWMLLAAPAYWNILAGYTDKYDGLWWRSPRYGIPVMLCAGPYVAFGGGDPLGAALWVVTAWLMGPLWLHRQKLGPYFDRKTEAIAGFCLLGGMGLM